MTCIETGTFQGLIVASEKFPTAIREIPFEEEELHLDTGAAREGHPMLEELLPERIVQVLIRLGQFVITFVFLFRYRFR